MIDRITRWQAFMDMRTDLRRLFICEGVQREAAPPLSLPYYALFQPQNRSARAQYRAWEYQEMLRRAEWLNDDALPYLNAVTGTEIFAEAFGCKVHYSDTDMPFALPFIHNAVEAGHLTAPKLADSTLMREFDVARALQKNAPDALISLPDIQSPLDIAALIWEKSDFYAALIEEPDAVMELCAKIFALTCEFLDAWFSEFGHTYIAHFPAYCMFGGMTLSEDEAGAISPSAFETFALPFINAFSRRYGGVGMHCCADARHQWDNYLKIENLRFLNLVQPLSVLEKAIPLFSSRVPQWHMAYKSVLPFDPYFKDAHAVLTINAQGQSKPEICEKLEQIKGVYA